MTIIQGVCPPDEAQRLLRKHLQVISLELRQMDSEDAIFHGCWDWHSSVHGHLAMLLGSEALGWQAQVDWLVSRLDSPALATVLARLAAQPDFERPYGRAWLLHLMAQLRRHVSLVERHDALAGIAADLAAWLSHQDLAATGPDYDDACFVLGALYAWGQSDEADDAWRQKVETELGANPANLVIDADPPGAFFSPWAMQVLLIEKVLGQERLKAWINSHEMVPLAVIDDLHSVHHRGIYASRAWGFWAAFQATSEPHWQEAAQAHLHAADALHDQGLGDRYGYSHWLPQWTVLAVLGGLGSMPPR